MTLQEGSRDSRGQGAGTAWRQPHDRAYFLDMLGDSHRGLGRHEAAVEAYQQAAEVFRAQGAECSYALCLFKIADGHLCLGEPWHALGYLEACLPLLRDLGLRRYEALARERLEACRVELAGVCLPGEGRPGRHPSTAGGRPGPEIPAQPERCRRIRATRVDSCHGRDRRTAALADP